MISYGRQTIEQDDIDAVVRALKSDWLTQGPLIEEFEKALATFVGAKYAVVFSNGTTALQAAYFAAGLGKNDEIIVPAITFAATSNAALWLNAKPVFVDVDPKSGNIDPTNLEKSINSKTKILAPVDYAGHPVDHSSVLEIAKKRGLIVIEDACHALGAQWKGKPVGSFSDMTVFSFHPLKSITTGEGGAVVTNNSEYYDRLTRFRHHGIERKKFKRTSAGPWYHEMQDLGLNARLTDFQSALGLSQLSKLPVFLKKRKAIADRYLEAFAKESGLHCVVPNPGDQSAWHLFAIVLNDSTMRSKLIDELKNNGIGSQVHYIPVYRHPYYEDLGYPKGLCPKAEMFSESVLSLPIYPTLSEADQKKVISTVKSVLNTKHESRLHR